MNIIVTVYLQYIKATRLITMIFIVAEYQRAYNYR